MANNPQFKINQIAKDMGKKSKDIVELLVEKGVDVKNSQKTLEAEEFDIFFDTITKANQITEIENYLDGITYIPAKEKPAEKAEAPAAEKKTEAKPAEVKEEVKAEVKAEVKKETKAAVKEEKKEEKKEESANPAPKKEEAKPAPKKPPQRKKR